MDLNGDGNIDLLSATYSGLSFIFYGNNTGSLNKAVILKDKSGTVINLGTYYDLKPNQNNLIYGKEKNADKGDFVKAHDWDNDGDLDLLISGSNGVKLRINEGTKTKPVFGTKNIEVVPAHYADAIIDWDGDGLWDIVGGSKKGGVYFYKNTGKLGSPSFDTAKCIIKSDEFIDKTREGICGITQIAVADYNNDGKADIIIGNKNSSIKQSKLEVVQKIKEGEVKVNKLESLLKEALKNNDDEAFEIMKKLNELKSKYKKYYTQPLHDQYGYVWVSLRCGH